MNLQKILFDKNQLSFKRWIQSSIGLFISSLLVFIILGAFSSFYKSEIRAKDMDGYFMISKSVDLANTIFGKTSTFKEDELKSLRESGMINNLAIVKSPSFECNAQFFENGNFRTEIVLEAIPKDMLDQPNFRFFWKKDMKKVPIIISNDFLRLYNFVYAPIAGLPPVSPENLSLVPVLLELRGKGKQEKIQAEIVGFTDRFNGLFVPVSFMDWANETFSNSDKTRTGKLIVKVKPSEMKAFENYIVQNSLESNRENLRLAKSASLIFPVIFAFAAIMLFFIALSVSNFWLQWKWLISQQSNHMELLYFQGYRPEEIQSFFFKRLVSFIVVNLILVILSGSIIWFSLKKNILLLSGSSQLAFPIETLLALIILYLLISIWLFFALRKFCLKTYR